MPYPIVAKTKGLKRGIELIEESTGVEAWGTAELEFLKSLWVLGTEEEEGYRTGPPGYTGWRNSFLGIDSGAPYTLKNTGSGSTWTFLYMRIIYRRCTP